MKILRCDLQAFGAYTDTTFQFKDGWNLMVGPNELGKTTLLHFIEGMLYGFLNPASKTRRTVPPYERYRRTDGRYHGAMVVEHDGQIYRLERDFNQHALTVYNEATGQDISDRLVQHPVFKHVDCAQWFDLPYPFFKNSVRLTQQELMPDDSAQDYLVSRLQNLEATGSQSLSATKALAYLKDQSDRIRLKTKGQLGPYQRVIQSIEELDAKRLAAQEEYDRFHKEEAELKELQTHYQTLESQTETLFKRVHNHKVYTQAQEKRKLLETLKPYGLIWEGQPFQDAPQAYVAATTSTERLHLIQTLTLWLERTQRLNEATLTRSASQTFAPEFEALMDDWSALEKELAQAQKEYDRTTLQMELYQTQLNDDTQELSALHDPLKPQLKVWMILLIVPLIVYGFRLAQYHSALKKVAHERHRLEDKRRQKEKNIAAQAQANQAIEARIQAATTAIQALKETHGLAYPSALMAQAAYEESLRQKRQETSLQALKETWTLEQAEAQTTLLPWLRRFGLTVEPSSCEILREALTQLDAFERAQAPDALTLLNTPLDAGIRHDDVLTLEREYERAQSEKEGLKSTLMQKEARLNAVAERLIDPATLAASREELMAEKAWLDERLHQLKAAMDLIEKAQERNEDNFAPLLAQTMAHSLSQITQGRYDALKIRQTLAFKVTDDAGALKTQTHFSTGTVDQIALAIRLGLLQALNRLNVPLLLDDAFSMYDEDRLAHALKHIASLGFTQVVCFSAHRRETDLLTAAKIPFHALKKEGFSHAKR